MLNNENAADWVEFPQAGQRRWAQAEWAQGGYFPFAAPRIRFEVSGARHPAHAGACLQLAEPALLSADPTRVRRGERQIWVPAKPFLGAGKPYSFNWRGAGPIGAGQGGSGLVGANCQSA